MKKLLCATVLAGVIGCHSGSSAAPSTRVHSSKAGAATATEAIQLFFEAVRAGDLQGMSLVWGTKEGPTRDHIPPAELEKREVILRCYFNHDAYRITGAIPEQRDGQSFHIELTRGQMTRKTTVSTIQGSDGRWYVQSLDIAAVRDMCGSSPENP